MIERISKFWSNLWSSSSSSSSSATEAGPSMASNVEPTTNKYENSRLNDLVYRLRAGTSPNVDVVFFHGLPLNEDDASSNQAFWRIWTKRGSDECWPVTMLPNYLAEQEKDGARYDPRVLAVSYDSRFKLPPDVGNKCSDDYLLSENLTTDLILSSKVGVGQERPVILVGHDLGGILIKQLILYVEDRAADGTVDDERDKLDKFLRNLRSVFFYSTPHKGSSAIERLAKEIPNKTQNQMLQFMSVLGKEMSRVNGKFTAYRLSTSEKPRFQTFALTASYLTNKGYFKGEQVCLEGSARDDIDIFYTVHADHYDVCRPEATWSNIIAMLGDNIVSVVDKFKEEETERRYRDLEEFNKRKYKLKGSGGHVDEPLGEAIASSSPQIE